MRKYLLSISILLIAVSILVLIARLINGTDEPNDVSQSEQQVVDFPTEDVFISDYFDAEFDDEFSNSTSIAEKDFETCDLLGERVREGTIIFDSTCASSEEDDN